MKNSGILKNSGTGKKRIFYALAAALLIAAIWSIAGSKDEKKNAQAHTVTVKRGDIEEIVTAQGKLEPKEYVDVGTQVSGQLKTLHVDIGDNVTKGDLLAEIDPRIYEARVDADNAQLKSLKAQLAEQEVNLELTRKQHARNETLIKTNAISKDAFDISVAAVKSAQAKVNTQKAQIEQTQSTLKGDITNLGYTKIYAPMTATVVTLPARAGQTLNASQTAPTLMQLANLDIMTIRAQVAEADITRLKEGMEVHFTTLGALEKKWDAKVRQILPSPEVINDVVLYDVLIDVDNHERQLMNGMSTQVFFELGSAENVLIIPVEALGKREAKEDSEAGLGYMVRLKGGKTVLTHVGLMDRANVEIRDGLSEGDEVLITTRQPQASGNKKQAGGRPGGMGGGPRL
jgi:macrolide-specific efflux system membrane fusion protein